MDDELKLFIATIYGESGNSSPVAWQAIGCVIKNRVGRREWKQHDTVTKVIERTGFDAYTQKTAQYRLARRYLDDRPAGGGGNALIERMIATLTPVYGGATGDITSGAVLYYSPKAQAALHKSHPESYAEKPRWNFGVLEEVAVPGIAATDDFKFYRYR